MALVSWNATIIIRHIIKLQKEMTREKSIGLAYIYCDYMAEDQSALDYVGALLRQLVNLSEEVSPEVVTLYKDHQPGSSPPSTLLEGYGLALETEIRRFESVYIVVDALDECRDDDEGEFQPCTRARVLQTLGSLGDKIHVLFTSRDERPAVSLPDPTMPIAIMKVLATENDIRTYVQARIEGSQSLKHNTDSGLREDIKKTVAKKAAGMFLPAKLYMQILVNTANGHSRKSAIKKALRTLPQFDHTQILESYQKAYRAILKNIWFQGPFKVNLARRVLSWVIFTREPSGLTLPVLQQALLLEDAESPVGQNETALSGWDYDINDRDEDEQDEASISDDPSNSSASTHGDVILEETILSVCRGLITIDQVSKHIRFVHYTAQTYFSNENVRAESFPHAQSQLTESCIASLLSKEVDHPFSRYSCRHWGHHAQMVEEQFQDKILDLFRNREKMLSSFQLVVDSLSPAWTTEPHEPNNNSLPPLYVAAYFGLKLTATHLMSEYGTLDILRKDCRGWNAMMWAVVGGSLNLVRLLFRREKDLLSNDIIFSAAGSRVDEIQISKVYIPHGKISLAAALVPKAGLSFTKALPKAIRPNTSDDVIRFLLDNIETERIDLKRESDGRTLLSVLAGNWQWDYVQILLERGASVDLKDTNERTPLLWALQCPRCKIKIDSIIVSEESSLSIGEIQCLEFPTTVSIKDYRVSEMTVEPFICKLIGNDLESTNDDGRTALSLACESRFHTVVDKLLSKGARSNTKDTLGMTPLHYACSLPCFRTVVIEYLFCVGESKTRLGTAELPKLHLRKKDNTAKSLGRTVDLLLQVGAETGARNYLGETPASLAESDGLVSCQRLLDPLKFSSDKQSGTKSGFWQEEEDCAKLLVALLDYRSRFQVRTLRVIDHSRLISHSSLTAEVLLIQHGSSVILSNKAKIDKLTVCDDSTTEIRTVSVIGDLKTHHISRTVIYGPSSIQSLSGSEFSTLVIKGQVEIKDMTLSERCAAYVSGNTKVNKIDGLDKSSFTITEETRVEQIRLDNHCTMFSIGESRVNMVQGFGSSRIVLMGSSFAARISVFDACVVICGGHAHVERMSCTGQSFVSLKENIEIRRMDREGGASILAEDRVTVRLAFRRDGSSLSFHADTETGDAEALAKGLADLRSLSGVVTTSSLGHLVVIFDEGDIIVKIRQIAQDGPPHILTDLDSSSTVDEKESRSFKDRVNRLIEVDKQRWCLVQNKLVKHKERQKEAEDSQGREEEWNLETKGEESKAASWNWGHLSGTGAKRAVGLSPITPMDGYTALLATSCDGCLDYLHFCQSGTSVRQQYLNETV
ncbi:uncharacterized protein NECHADRAFT_85502 [Fusarium vanettenii 77-13-4]|uniref:Nephrocystin 3-like N-terminal domain-containing protein n=1 Tax=Fusarium vanettenii (strain ATCC MYA-4622 / CBS 123669 / FGSC 9596 / NRRL 45880 / 77-13-4) TaxID=660122 RepID=C7ZP16_FUSV7|nr:uncharacterized protein NECHADRAFT_85502 [Fusarium vanettenii 77-13-4]EEU34232.1 hypothetical protein NECHADRAFT_85502 [Fusarium vanettenii 77-13-4]